jgi:hypothetical protein
MREEEDEPDEEDDETFEVRDPLNRSMGRVRRVWRRRTSRPYPVAARQATHTSLTCMVKA